MPNKEQLKRIIAYVEQGLKVGALGISATPGMGCKEYFELATLAARYKVATYTHDRYTLEPLSSFEALEEQVGLGASATRLWDVSWYTGP